ncbi:hypothetical protein ADEAN_000051300 [Angomonas deanei]|uniref:Uncharacterized protein n=1 Tax=Angomonas deanei TaxID=59799 RepID=A0A7G2C2Z2_9TRYP|nr:hypothetical protein ADEAN_000051300 [Angomonas deanei]
MRLEIPVPLSNVDTVRDPGVVVTIEHCVRKERGRSHSRFRSLSRNSRNSSCASSTFSSSCPRSCSSRANSTDRDTVQSAETKTVEDITATEIGRVKLSLRALLSKHLYPKGEVISVPIVANTRCIANRLPIERHTEFLRRVSEDYDHVPDMCILGSLSFSIQLPVGERIPLWLQLPACHKRRRAEYERGLSGTEVDDILHAHYDIFETGSILKEVGWETKSTSTTPTKRNTGDKLRLSRSSESSGVNMVSDSDPSSADVTYIHRSTIF